MGDRSKEYEMEYDLGRLRSATWEQLTEVQPEHTKTPIEIAPLDELPGFQKSFREEGVAVLKSFIPHSLLDKYSEARSKLPKDRSLRSNYWAGWHYPTPYQDCLELLDLATYPELQRALHALVGAEMGLHLSLTGWVSTERNWHQDTYLNPDDLWSFYAAVWIALEDIEPDSGPFEYVPGSHKWPALRRDKLFDFLDIDARSDPSWPTFTQNEVARACEEEMHRRGSVTRKHLPKKGDVLFWHSNLVHRGTEPENKDAERRALICHYSALSRRFDMNSLARHKRNGQLYFNFPK